MCPCEIIVCQRSWVRGIREMYCSGKLINPLYLVPPDHAREGREIAANCSVERGSSRPVLAVKIKKNPLGLSPNKPFRSQSWWKVLAWRWCNNAYWSFYPFILASLYPCYMLGGIGSKSKTSTKGFRISQKNQKHFQGKFARSPVSTPGPIRVIIIFYYYYWEFLPFGFLSASQSSELFCG